MRKPWVALWLAVLCAYVAAPFGQVATAATIPPHVMIVVMENHSYEAVIGNAQMPFINSLASANAVVSTTDLSHPSLPNYLGMISGSSQSDPQDTTPQDGTYPGPQQPCTVQPGRALRAARDRPQRRQSSAVHLGIAQHHPRHARRHGRSRRQLHPGARDAGPSLELVDGEEPDHHHLGRGHAVRPGGHDRRRRPARNQGEWRQRVRNAAGDRGGLWRAPARAIGGV